MTRTFIQTDEFYNNWQELGFTEDDLIRLEIEIMRDPKKAPVIPGTGSLRKMRFAMKDKGKSGSARVCYVDFVVHETIYLITAYGKNEKENLSKAECNAIKKLISSLEKGLN